MIKIVLVLILVGAVQAIAEPVIIQSGEHPRFTRLVASLEDKSWSVDRMGRTIVVEYSQFDSGFETDGIFDLIPRQRIKSVQGGVNRFTVKLACDCVASARTERNAFIVIDVADQLADLETPQAEILFSQPTPKIDTQRFSTAATPEDLIQGSLIRHFGLSVNEAPFKSHNPDLFSAFEERLEKSFEAATDRGLLSQSTSSYSKNENDNAIIMDSESAQLNTVKNAQAIPDKLSIAELPNQLRISTSHDLIGSLKASSEHLSSGIRNCLSDGDLNVSAWGEPGSFVTQISEARDNLYGPLDHVNVETAIKLAKLYIFFGFGAEAIDILRLVPDSVVVKEILTVLSQIMDDKPLPVRNILQDNLECSGEANFWAVLAAPLPPEGAFPAPSDALRTLNKLPRHLRVLLGPKLHKVLVAYGELSGAAASLRSIERVSHELVPETRISIARNYLENGDMDKAEENLLEVLRRNTEQAPVALVTLVNTRMNSNVPIGLDIISLLESYSKELRDTDIGTQLHGSHILSLAHSGQFDKAFELLDTDSNSVEASYKTKLFSKLAQKASDIVFLEHILEISEQQIRALPSNELLIVGGRLLDLGFPLEAERIMESISPRSHEPQQQILRAEISLALGKPSRASADLLNIEGPTADRLRAESKRMSGLYSEAHAIYENLGQNRDAAEAAWLSEEWRTLLSKDAPTFGPSIELPISPPPLASSGPSLSRSSTLVKQSSETLSILQNLLTGTETADSTQ